jgi:iron complex transport system substrate-binding protein
MNTNLKSPKPPTAVASDITRRRFLAGAGGLLVLGAAGCGTGRSGGGASGAAEARKIQHKYGSTEASGSPERVVTVGFNEQDPVLALGVEPVGVRDWFGDQPNAVWPWAQDELGDAEPAVLSSGELNFERIAALEPDLILGIFSGMTEDEYETLSELAPTVARPQGYVDYGVPWREQTRVIGLALGREERARALISDVEARFEETRQTHPEFEGATGAVALLDEGGTYNVYGPKDLRGRFMEALGFELPPEISELAGDDFFAGISEERLDLLDVDALVWIVNSQDAADALRNNPLYGRLDVAKKGRDLFLDVNDPIAGALSFSTVLSLPFALDRLTPMLAAAIAGDPATESTEVNGATTP